MGINFSYPVEEGVEFVLAEVASAGNVACLVKSACPASSAANVAYGTVPALVDVVDGKSGTFFQCFAILVYVDY